MLLEDGDHRKLAGPWNQAEAEDVQNRILDNTNAWELCSIDPASTRVAVTLTPTVPCVSVGGGSLCRAPTPRSLFPSNSLAQARAQPTRHCRRTHHPARPAREPPRTAQIRMSCVLLRPSAHSGASCRGTGWLACPPPTQPAAPAWHPHSRPAWHPAAPGQGVGSG